MNYNESVSYIHSLGNFNRPATLERITKLLSALGNPQESFKAIHIAGTNGKGSVSAMLSSVFREAGLKTGLFISPYVIDFRERIQVNGEYIPEQTLAYLSDMVKATRIDVSEFEFITAVGFLYFARMGCDVAVIETGLGGRLDATNTLSKVDVAVITKIGLDHTKLLGDTLESIAEEKCGIIHGFKTVSAPLQHPDVRRVIEKHCKTAVFPDLERLRILFSDINGNSFIYKEREYKTKLAGLHQIHNALTVIETLDTGGYNIPYPVIYKGIEKACFPARIEVISKRPLVILDGAHNPDGAAALAEFMKPYSDRITAIVGVMQDKDYKDLLKITLPHCKNAVALAVPDMPRSLPADELCKAVAEYCSCTAAKDANTALLTAKSLAGENPIFVFGSLYLACALRPLLFKNF